MQVGERRVSAYACELCRERAMANEEVSLVAFCDAEDEERVEDCVFIEGDLSHLCDAGVTRRLLHAARETSQEGRGGVQRVGCTAKSANT